MLIKFMAPVSGPLVPLENVPDPVFSQKLVGDGLAIEPLDQILRSPFDGKIIQLHSSHHAITVENDMGVQVLLHIGLDTVNLKGRGFIPKIRVGDRVRAGQELIIFDSDFIAQEAKSLVTLMIITESKNGKLKRGGSLEFPLELEVESSAERFDDEIIIELPTGLHARPAALLANMAKQYKSEIEIIKKSGGKSVSANAKSVVAILSLEILHGDKISFVASGSDGAAAIKELSEFLKNLREENASVAPIQRGLTGVAASPGVILGKVYQFREKKRVIEDKASLISVEEPRFKAALAIASMELRELQKQSKSKGIFSAHQELLDDPDLMTAMHSLLEQGKDAAFAWLKVIGDQARRLEKLKNEVMAARASDLKDVGERVLSLLLNEETFAPDFSSDCILIADALTPSDVLQMAESKVLGFATTGGGATSHVAILARSLGIPAIAGCDVQILNIPNGEEIVLDGNRGEIRRQLSEKEKEEIELRQSQFTEKRKVALAYSKDAALTTDAREIKVTANIGSVTDAVKAVEMGCDGVGLLRSEFIFLDRETAPTEEEQLQVYQEIADILGARPFTIRTLDVGGDKPLSYLKIPQEDNPFLGERGIRIGLKHPDILREQLRAILRVKSRGEIHIMFPMISLVEEFQEAKAIYNEECQKLDADPTSFKVGLMMEVPSAVLMAEELAQHADFFSIGTNDLAQYTLAMDRGHGTLSKKVDALHPSILKLIEITVKGAKKHGRPVAVCGGLASDGAAVSILIGLGVTELSVSVPSIPLIKSAVRENSFSNNLSISKKSLNSSSAGEVRLL